MPEGPYLLACGEDVVASAPEGELRAGDWLLVDPAAEPPVVRLDPARGEAEVARLRILLALGEIDADRLAVDAVADRAGEVKDAVFDKLGDDD